MFQLIILPFLLSAVAVQGYDVYDLGSEDASLYSHSVHAAVPPLHYQHDRVYGTAKVKASAAAVVNAVNGLGHENRLFGKCAKAKIGSLYGTPEVTYDKLQQGEVKTYKLGNYLGMHVEGCSIFLPPAPPEVTSGFFEITVKAKRKTVVVLTKYGKFGH